VCLCVPFLTLVSNTLEIVQGSRSLGAQAVGPLGQNHGVFLGLVMKF
jgi:hypothetical protein